MKEDILPAFPERNIPIVFSANDQFVPIMATMILSIAENASAQNNYDILIMTRDISSDSENKLRQMLAPFANFSLRICNVSEYIQGYDLYTENRKSISVETYFRLVLPELLPMYDKVLYLDGDMVAATDVAQLYETDIQDYLVASCRDADGIGRCYKPGETRREYRENTLKIQNLDDYFCAGTLLMNLDRFRKELPTKKLLEFASSYPWQWHDQDVLNALCQGKTLMVDMSWGLMRDAGNNHYMPEALYKEFLEAEKDPKIIHYGGTRKPWLYLDVVRGEYFWKYAVRTPFYQEILALVQKGKKEKKSKTIDPKKAKDVVLKQFQKGEIGFDYLRKYFGAWLHRVFKRSK